MEMVKIFLLLLAVRCKGRGPFKRKQTNLEKIVQRLNKGKKSMKTSPSKENAKKDFHSLNFEEGRNMLNASNAPAYDHLTIQESITSKGYATQHWITEPIFEQPNTLQEFNNICNTIQPQKMRGFNMKNSAQPSFAEGIQKTIHKKGHFTPQQLSDHGHLGSHHLVRQFGACTPPSMFHTSNEIQSKKLNVFLNKDSSRELRQLH
ncbi:hypothetical protein IFM89_024422 [Coptis chinensis]|uniref:Uncharacterized protein n=1 Tax=Coptis chinensis TaxID=261450 RepID=A0A835LSN5_9MAGN|nr:hypothetical protein IFM89_024422 [Coptis chinensis]